MFSSVRVKSRLSQHTNLASIPGWTEKSHLAWFSQEDGARGIWKKESTRTSTNNRMSSSNSSTHSPDETTLDWSYKLLNKRLRNITKTRPIRDFCYIQQLKYMGHICRLDNCYKNRCYLIAECLKLSWTNERIFGMDITNKNYDEEKLTNPSPGQYDQTQAPQGH